MREDAVDWYIRSRHDLLKSSLDGFDYDLSVANFAFSKLNLNRHGYNLEKSTEDLLCDSIILKELGGDVLQEIALLEHQLKTKDIPQEKQFEILDEISRLEEKLRTTEHITDDTTRTTEMIRGAEQKLSAHPHSGRMKELELKDISSSWPDMDVAPDKHYSEAHVFHKQHHPLRGMNSRTGRNHMIEKIRSFYLPSKVGGISESERVKKHENEAEKIHSKKKNVSIVGVNKYDRDKGINEVSHPYMGPLHGNGTISSLHDLYIHRLEQWKRNNPEVIKDTIDKFPNPDAHNHALQQLHFEDWADELESNEYHPINVKPKDDMTEKEITDMLYSGEDTSPLDEFPVKKGLGMGYWFGLEALDPVQRHKVMSHLHTKGSVDKGNQIINLGDGMKISTGRINRNIAHRFSPEFFHYGRPVHLHGANVKKHIESDNDHPEGEDFYLKHALHKALMETPHGSDDGNQTTMGAHLLSEINDNLFDMPQWDEELKTHFDSNNKPVNLLQHLPIKAIKQAKSIRQKALKHKSLDYQDAIKEELQLLDEKDPHTYLDKNTLLDLLGYEADGSPLGEDNHSIIPNFEQPFFNKEKIDELLINARDIADLSAKAKPMRNFDAYNYLGKNGPDWNDIPEDEKESWLTSKNGDAVGIGSHFSQIFHSRGGHGKNRLSFLEMIHDTLPKDEDGYSLIGKIDNGEFKPNRKNIGMFGRYIPSLYDKRFQTHSGPHGATSLWDASSHLSGRARNPKNMPFFDMTSLSGGYSNKVRYLTPSERGDMIDGQSNNHLLDRHGHFTTNPLLAVGGRDNKLTQTKSNSKMALNKITSLGATYPPHAPAPFVTLNRKEIKSGRFPLSHSEGNVNLYSLFHEYDGKTLDADWQSKVKLSSDNQYEVDNLESEGNRLHEELNNYEEGSDESIAAHKRILEIENAVSSIYESSLTKNNSGYTDHFDQLEHKDQADLKAIIEMAKIIKPHLIKADPTAFDSSNPAKFIANTSRLMKDANRALLTLDHSEHGLTTHGYEDDNVENSSVSQLVSNSLGKKTVPHHKLALTLANAGKEIRPDMSDEKILSELRLPNNTQSQELITRLRENLDDPVKILTHGDILASGSSLHPNLDLSRFSGIEDHHAALEEFKRNHPYNQVHHSDQSERKKAEKGFNSDLKQEYLRKLGFLTSIMSRGYSIEGEKYGLSHLPTTDPTKDYGKKKNAYGSSNNKTLTGSMNDVKSQLHDLFILNPNKVETMDAEIAPSHQTTIAKWDSGREIHPASSRGHSVQDMYISGSTDKHYDNLEPSVGIEFTGSPHPETGMSFAAGTYMQPESLPSVQQPIMEALHGQEATEQVLTSGYQVPNPTINWLKPNIIGLPPNADPTSIAKTLEVLMNPDALLKKDEAKPPPVLPMHRIFTIKDFNSLRGFSGDWVVSSYYDGERVIVTRKKDKVSAYDRNGEVVPLNEKDITQFKALTERNYTVDVIKTKNEIHVIDILNYDDTNIADLNVRERLKVLRGQFDSHEHILVPGPHNTRVTDEGGLEATVKSLQEEHNQLLLRDTKSTYMLGESRHPKWFLLRKNKDVSLIILDVRGKGPYTYRLGAGPVDEDGLGNRGVKHEGKNYLDVGTITSPKPFNEGEVIKVSVSGVKKKNRNGKTLYDVTSSKIRGESESEGAVSLETLSLLAKSHPLIPVPYELQYENERLVVAFEGIDDVIYKLESTHTGVWPHSPYSLMGDLSKSEYPILLAESLKPLWSQAASLIKKGVYMDNKEKKKFNLDHAMTDSKDREETEEESAGIIEAEDDDNILKPKMNVMVKALARIAELTERIDTLQKEKMSGGPGARGMGIDVGSGIESPRGPTSLTSEESLPDWDMIDRPTEDMEEEYPHVRNKRLKQKNAEQSNVYETASEED